MNAWPGVRLEATSAPSALAFTASMKLLMTGSATSASSSATRTSRSVSADVLLGNPAAPAQGIDGAGEARGQGVEHGARGRRPGVAVDDVPL